MISGDRLRGIYAIVDAEVTPDGEALLAALLAGGIRLVQYRAKGGVARDVVRRLRARTRAAGAWLIVNDDPEAAALADGLHVGQEDLVALGPDVVRAAAARGLLGISTGDAEQARIAESYGAAYLGVGPYAVTRTKADAGGAIGAAGLRRVVAATRLPVAAIGGIGEADLPAIAATGAAMVAVVSALAYAPDPAAAARTLSAAFARAVRP